MRKNLYDEHFVIGDVPSRWHAINLAMDKLRKKYPKRHGSRIIKTHARRDDDGDYQVVFTIRE